MTPDDSAPVGDWRRQALRLLQQSGDDVRGPSGPTDSDFAATGAEAPRTARTRAVMIAAVTMPAVFFVVVAGALALFGKPAAVNDEHHAVGETLIQPAAAPAAGVTMAAARTSRPATIALSEDMRIADISLDGDRVALHVESPMGQEILIYDFVKGRMIAEAPIETASLDTVDTLAMLTGAPQPARPPAAREPTSATPEAAVATPPLLPTSPPIKPRSSD